MGIFCFDILTGIQLYQENAASFLYWKFWNAGEIQYLTNDENADIDINNIGVDY